MNRGMDAIVTQVAEHHIRALGQAQSSTSTMATPSASTGLPSPTPSPTGGSGSGNGPTSSPLLFFVALGFGVVFTNLWIIVGVKYCFRYNQRNRRAQQGEDGEPIDLNAMPRAHRRRREKKLMTMEEVNERFPLMKYKAWMASRAEEGLPTAGGVAAPSSRPGSVRNADGALDADDHIRKSHESHQSQIPTTSTAPTLPVTLSEKSSPPEPTESEPKEQPLSSPPTSPKSTRSTKVKSPAPNPAKANLAAPADNEDDHSDMEDDDQIQNAVPTEMMEHPGDSCAICIDTLENDDDVRGLSCGHAFHASCLDPWLTSRRACCPLCKADYYIPKPRPEGDTTDSSTQQPGTGNIGRRPVGMSSVRLDGPPMPQPAYVGGRGRPRMILPGRFITIGHAEGRQGRYGFPTIHRQPRGDNAAPAGSNGEDSNSPNEGQTQPAGWRSRLPNVRIPRPSVPGRFRRGQTGDMNTTVGDTSAANPPSQQTRTPGQLEAAA